ncbi:MAG: DUF3524 domain-containing protein, partial [Bacteroidota bacterium]
MKVLALEPWYGGSHRNFLDGLKKHSQHDVHAVTMSARFWKWRMHGGAVTMARKVNDWVAEGNKPDVILASDMVNVPAFLALCRPSLSDVPVILYLHENQLTYPLKEGRERDYTYAYINYLSCLAADAIVFNSKFHHDEFLDALPVMLRAFPDYNHLHSVEGPGIVAQQGQRLGPDPADGLAELLAKSFEEKRRQPLDISLALAQGRHF